MAEIKNLKYYCMAVRIVERTDASLTLCGLRIISRWQTGI